MAHCPACQVNPASGDGPLCEACRPKRYGCRVCGTEFGYTDLLDRLPVFQCPTCEGRTIDEIL